MLSCQNVSRSALNSLVEATLIKNKMDAPFNESIFAPYIVDQSKMIAGRYTVENVAAAEYSFCCKSYTKKSSAHLTCLDFVDFALTHRFASLVTIV